MKNQVVGVVTLMLFFFLVTSSHAQTTAFTYQGSLKDGASLANGNYDFEFKLFDLASGGFQQRNTIQKLNVAAANGFVYVTKSKHCHHYFAKWRVLGNY